MVASNRGPLSFRFDEEGGLVRSGPAGGLAGTLQPLLRGTGSTWISASMSDADQEAATRGLMVEEGLRLFNVRPTPEVYRSAYDVVSNATLWFCLHQLWDLSRRPRFDARWLEAWDAYRELNRQFADLIANEAPEGSAVLVQDYHLLLTGEMLAQARPDLRTVHFLHTPFSGPDVLRVLPGAVARELLSGMAGFGACGFHTARWEAAFRLCLADREIGPARREAAGAKVLAPRTFVAPIGPVPSAITAESTSEACREARDALRRQVGDRALVVRVDRVELSKNILRGCWAVEELLRTRPRWRERFVLLALAYPSREGLPEYLAYRAELEHTVERINETWAVGDWAPIVLDVADDRSRSLAALCEYDVLLVNPLRDGMNLVAKEGPLVNTRDGVVALSREAGAWEELEDAALGLNPYDLAETAQVLEKAMTMDPAERRQRAADLRRRVEARPARHWLDDQLAVAASLTGPRAPTG